MNDSQIISADKWLIIVNPNAGSKKGARDWTKICHLLSQEGFDYHCVFTEHRNHAILLTEQNLAKGYRNLAVVGGDGTMNEVLNGIMSQTRVPFSEITLGMIPVGTGNDWCRTLGVPFDYKKAVGVLKAKKIFTQDIGKVTYHKQSETQVRYFLNVAGMGYDALVAKKTNLLKEKGKGGPLAYLYFVFASLFQYKFLEGVIEVDDTIVFKGEIFSMNVGICKYNGGGMMQVPFAIPDDGLLDMMLIKKASKFIVIRHTSKLYDGTLVSLPIVKTFRGKNIRIRSTDKIYLEADGESLGHTPFTFEIIPTILRVVTGN
ncbi:MAG: diacylglycerol kinase family protein [bacterium]